MVMGVPASHMRPCQPLQIGAKRTIPVWPDHQMPMVGHDEKAEQTHLKMLPCLPQDLLKCRIIGRFAKKGGAANRAIKDVVDITRLGATCTSSHTIESDKNSPRCQAVTQPDPFDFPWYVVFI